MLPPARYVSASSECDEFSSDLRSCEAYSITGSRGQEDYLVNVTYRLTFRSEERAESQALDIEDLLDDRIDDRGWRLDIDEVETRRCISRNQDVRGRGGLHPAVAGNQQHIYAAIPSRWIRRNPSQEALPGRLASSPPSAPGASTPAGCGTAALSNAGAGIRTARPRRLMASSPLLAPGPGTPAGCGTTALSNAGAMMLTAKPRHRMASFPPSVPGTDTLAGCRTTASSNAGAMTASARPRRPRGEFASVSAGFNHTCGVRDGGSVECWGGDTYGEATPPDGEFASVSAGTWPHLRTAGRRAPSNAGDVVTWAKPRRPMASSPPSASGSDTPAECEQTALSNAGAGMKFGATTPPRGRVYFCRRRGRPHLRSAGRWLRRMLGR